MNSPHGRRDYIANEVQAARCVLAELMELLEEYRHGIVVVGGWVPSLAITSPNTPHEGTKDIDLVLDAQKLQADGEETIEEILMKALYQQDEKSPFRWYKHVPIEGKFISVIVDFLAPENQHYTDRQLQRIQDIPASTMRGCDVAFQCPLAVTIDATKPDGETVQTTFQVAAIPNFLAMKGLALHNRDRQPLQNFHWPDDARKDASDIYYVVKNYTDGHEALAADIAPLLQQPAVRESFEKIAAKWKSVNDRGPFLVAMKEDNSQEKQRLQRDAYEQVIAVLRLLPLDK